MNVLSISCTPSMYQYCNCMVNWEGLCQTRARNCKANLLAGCRSLSVQCSLSAMLYSLWLYPHIFKPSKHDDHRHTVDTHR